MSNNRKGPGYFARMYGTGRKSFLEATKGYRESIAGGACIAKGTGIRTPQPASKMGAYLLAELDFAAVEQHVQSWACAKDFAQVEAHMDFAAAAGATLAAVNADPRNHFGKHALRRFDK